MHIEIGCHASSEPEGSARRSSNSSKRKRSGNHAPQARDTLPSRRAEGAAGLQGLSSDESDEHDDSLSASASSSASSSPSSSSFGSSRTSTNRASAHRAARPSSASDSDNCLNDDELVTIESRESASAQPDPAITALLGQLPDVVQQNIDKCMQAYVGQYPNIFLRLLVKSAVMPSPLPHVKIREVAYLVVSNPETSRKDIDTLIQYNNRLHSALTEVKTAMQQAGAPKSNVRAVSLFSRPSKKIATGVSWLELLVGGEAGLSRADLVAHLLSTKKFTHLPGASHMSCIVPPERALREKEKGHREPTQRRHQPQLKSIRKSDREQVSPREPGTDLMVPPAGFEADLLQWRKELAYRARRIEAAARRGKILLPCSMGSCTGLGSARCPQQMCSSHCDRCALHTGRALELQAAAKQYEEKCAIFANNSSSLTTAEWMEQRRSKAHLSVVSSREGGSGRLDDVESGFAHVAGSASQARAVLRQPASAPVKPSPESASRPATRRRREEEAPAARMPPAIRISKRPEAPAARNEGNKQSTLIPAHQERDGRTSALPATSSKRRAAAVAANDGQTDDPPSWTRNVTRRKVVWDNGESSGAEETEEHKLKRTKV